MTNVWKFYVSVISVEVDGTTIEDLHPTSKKTILEVEDGQTTEDLTPITDKTSKAFLKRF